MCDKNISEADLAVRYSLAVGTSRESWVVFSAEGTDVESYALVI